LLGVASVAGCGIVADPAVVFEPVVAFEPEELERLSVELTATSCGPPWARFETTLAAFGVCAVRQYCMANRTTVSLGMEFLIPFHEQAAYHAYRGEFAYGTIEQTYPNLSQAAGVWQTTRRPTWPFEIP
jgi:hypothetical protein